MSDIKDVLSRTDAPIWALDEIARLRVQVEQRVSVELLQTERATADRLREDNAKLRSQVEGTNRALCAADKLVSIHRDYTTMPAPDFDTKYQGEDGTRLLSEARSDYVVARSLSSDDTT